jgi:hypothetical protein
LTDFIVSKWRQDSLVKLVNSNGNIKVTLDISVIDFEKNVAFIFRRKVQA